MQPDKPTKIGSFEIKAELTKTGSTANGQAELYLAYDQNFGSDVVVKVLPKDFFQDSDFRVRFEQAVKTLALLEHPAVVQIYDLSTQDERTYLAMRYMVGGSLANYLENQPLHVDEALHIVERIAGALDDIHARGLVHGRIHPSNILFDEFGEAYLSDCSMQQPELAETRQVVNVIPAHLAYLSPEQLIHGTNVDRRSDVYALGVLFFEMLTGQQPFPPSTVGDQALRQLTELPVDICQINPRVSTGIREVLDRAMEKDPDRRYRSAGEFFNAIMDVVESPEGESQNEVQSSSPGDQPDTQKKPRFAWAALLLGAGIFLGLSFSIYQGWINPITIQDRILALVLSPPPVITPSLAVIPAGVGTPVQLTATLENIPSQAAILPSPVMTKVGQVVQTATIPSTSTPIPSNTPTPLPPVIGGADKIAFVNEGEIWIANLDGTGMEQLTNDKTLKTDLQWTPDGLALTYSSEGCYRMLAVGTRKITNLLCVDDFEISPDMQMVVLGDDVIFPNETLRWMNFLAPFDISLIADLDPLPQTARSGGCPFFGGRMTRFSNDGQRMAAIFKAPQDGRQVEIVQVFDASVCSGTLEFIDAFPGERFKMSGYSARQDDPVLSDFGWNGVELFALHGNGVNGFGDLVIYSMLTGIGAAVNPVDGQCCYQDIQWSPDGQYLLFVFQDARYSTETRLYYIPYGTIGTNMTYQPMNFPFYFFSDPQARVEPALRPAK